MQSFAIVRIVETYGWLAYSCDHIFYGSQMPILETTKTTKGMIWQLGRIPCFMNSFFLKTMNSFFKYTTSAAKEKG